MRVSSFLGLIIGAIVLFVLVLVFVFRMKREAGLLEAIPDSASVALYLPSGSSFNQRLHSAMWWSALKKSEYFGTLSADLALLDSLLLKSGLSEATQDVQLVLALVEPLNKPSFVLFAKVGSQFPYWELHEKALPAFGNRFEIVKRKTGDFSTFLLIDRHSRRQISYAFAKGLAVASFDREAFEQALISLEKAGPNALSEAVSRRTEAMPDAVLLINPFRVGHKVSGLFAAQWSSGIIRATANMDKWLTLDVHLREDELMLNALLDNDPVFEDVDSRNRILTDSLTKWLPVNTLSFMTMYRKSKGGDTPVADVFSGLMTEGRVSLAGSSQPFWLVLPDRPAELLQLLYSRQPRIASPWNMAWSAPVDVANIVRGHFDNQRLTGNDRVYATTDGVGFLFSPNLTLLKNYLETRAKGLSDNNIKRLSGAIASHSGLMFYHQLSKAGGRLAEVSEGVLKYRLLRDAAALHGFESVSLQLSRAGESVYAGVLIRGNSHPMGQAIPLWSAGLGAGGALAPFMFNSPNEGRVVAFDSTGWMYGFSPDGRQLWKKNIGGIPLGTPIYVDVKALRRPYYLFNTASAVFLTDAAGNQAPGFPISLPSRATACLAFENQTTQAIYVNCADRRTYAFSVSGKPIPTWNPPLLSDISTTAPRVFSAGDVVYVLVAPIDGSLKIMDDSGLERIKPKEALNKANGADIHLNRTNARGIFLTTSPKGELIYIGSGGIARAPGPELFTNNHFFLYDDFDADQSPDLMFADGRRAVIFDRFNRIILNGTLPKELENPPFMLSGEGSRRIWCFDFARYGYAAIASAETGILNFSDLPIGGRYGFGFAEQDGSLWLGAYVNHKILLYRIL